MLTYFILVFMLVDFNVASADEIIIEVYHPLLSLNHENILLSPCVSPQLCNAGNSIGLSILVYHLPTRRNTSFLVFIGLLILLSGDVEQNPGPLTGMLKVVHMNTAPSPHNSDTTLTS